MRISSELDSSGAEDTLVSSGTRLDTSRLSSTAMIMFPKERSTAWIGSRRSSQSTNFVNVTFEEGVTVDFSRSRFTGPSASMAGTRFLTTKANLTQCDFGTCSFTACDLSKVKLGFETNASSKRSSSIPTAPTMGLVFTPCGPRGS